MQYTIRCLRAFMIPREYAQGDQNNFIVIQKQRSYNTSYSNMKSVSKIHFANRFKTRFNN